MARTQRLAAGACAAAAVAALAAGARTQPEGPPPLPVPQTHAHGHGAHAHESQLRARGRVTGYAQATWIRPATVKQLRAMATTVVYAEATASKRGPDAGPSGPSGRERSIPTQRVQFRLVRGLAGSAPADDFTVTYYGGSGLVLENNPEYEIGKKYILFLADHPVEPDTYDRVAIDGRLEEAADGRFQAQFRDAAAGELHGRTRSEIERLAHQ